MRQYGALDTNNSSTAMKVLKILACSLACWNIVIPHENDLTFPRDWLMRHEGTGRFSIRSSVCEVSSAERRLVIACISSGVSLIAYPNIRPWSPAP